MRKLVLAMVLLLGGCVGFSHMFDQAALAECREQRNSDDRRTCLSKTQDAAYERRQAEMVKHK